MIEIQVFCVSSFRVEPRFFISPRDDSFDPEKMEPGDVLVYYVDPDFVTYTVIGKCDNLVTVIIS